MKSLHRILSESAVLLLEYDAEKTWKQHGPKVLSRALSNQEAAMKGGPQAHERELSAYIDHHGGRHEDAREVLQTHLEKADPTPNKQYVQHIARIYGNGGAKMEDLHVRMKPALERYHELSKKKILAPEDRDIGRVKSLSHLEDIVDKHADSVSANDVDKAHHEKMKKQATITDHGTYTHIIPHTEEASAHFGKGTRWCTASTNSDSMFDHYNKKGPLQIFVPKKAAYAGEKYQHHYSSDSTMDEKDYHVSPETLEARQPDIHKHIEKYRNEMEAASHAPGALQHRERKVGENYLYDHASRDEAKHVLMTHPDHDMKYHAALNTKVTPEDIAEFVKSDHRAEAELSHERYSPEYDKLSVDLSRSRSSMADHNKLGAHHLTDIINHITSHPQHKDSYHGSQIISGALMNVHANKSHLDQVVAHEKSPGIKKQYAFTVLYNKEHDASHVEHYANHPDPKARLEAAQSNKATPEQIDRLSKDSDPLVRYHTLVGQNAKPSSPHVAHMAEHDPHEDVRMAARFRLTHPATHHHLLYPQNSEDMLKHAINRHERESLTDENWPNHPFNPKNKRN